MSPTGDSLFKVVNHSEDDIPVTRTRRRLVARRELCPHCDLVFKVANHSKEDALVATLGR